MKDQKNRYLKQPSGRRVWMYCRAVPKHLRPVDSRAPTVTISTGTQDLYEARQERDRLAKADEAYWAALEQGLAAEIARERYDAALNMRAATGSTWLSGRTFGELQVESELPVLEREYNAAWRAVAGKNIGEISGSEIAQARPAVEAIVAGKTGAVDKPEPDVREAAQFWIEKMIQHEWKNKSREQYRNWRNPIDRAVNNFERQIGPGKPLLKLTRQDALQFHQWLNDRVLAGEISPSTANRDLGVIRRIWNDHAQYQAIDAANPFRNLAWRVPKTKRLSFSVKWLRESFLAGEGLAGLNDEARRILLVMIETGARPSEIINLHPENIHLDQEIPHIAIRRMPGREIKTDSSERDLPLVGVALEAMTRQPEGFPRYRDRENAYSAAVNKYLRENGLAETPGHTIYCIRHCYEDRMKAAKLDLEMRMEIAGHRQSRPAYGQGYPLDDLREAMEGMALPFSLAV